MPAKKKTTALPPTTAPVGTAGDSGAADAIIEPATPVDIVKALIRALGHEPADVAGVDISSKYARIWGKDRSLRSHTIGVEWNRPEEEETPDD